MKVSDFLGLVEKVVELRRDTVAKEEEEEDGDEEDIWVWWRVGCKEYTRLAIEVGRVLVWRESERESARKCAILKKFFWSRKEGQKELDMDCVAVTLSGSTIWDLVLLVKAIFAFITAA